MTKIRDLLISFRNKRIRQLSWSDSVSFDAVYRDGSAEHSPKIKESSLIDRCVIQPNSSKADNKYQCFSEQPTEKISCPRPSFVTILLIILLMTVFLVLPIIYLLHCFNVLHAHWDHDFGKNGYLKEEVHYSPSSVLRDNLDPRHFDKTDFLRNAAERTFIVNSIKSLPPPPKPDYGKCKLIPDDSRFDCMPSKDSNAQACEDRGCCWVPKTEKTLKKQIGVPYCFYPSNYGGYKYINMSKTSFGMEAYLQRTFKSPYPDDVEIAKLIVKFENEDRLHVKLIDPNNGRYESPYPEVPNMNKASTNNKYSFKINLSQLGFQVVRKSDGVIIFDSTSIGGLTFADQFLQISANLPSKYIYGLGEHRTRLLLSTDWERLTMFNLDQLPATDLNLYGSQPLYLAMESSGNAHGVFLLNSNAMEVILQPAPAITFRTIGGVLDFYFFLGPTPADVVKQYTELVGRPYMPPLWSLGFHLCRYGYGSLAATRKVFQRTLDAGIPLDVQWNDLDYMASNNDFTYNKTAFKELPQFISELHAKGMHYVPLIDAAVSGSETPGSYPPYDMGIAMDIFVKNASGQPFIGKVWNKASSVWPDFTHPNTVEYWTTLLRNLHNEFEFDGAWIDMNEPSNFFSGSVDGCPESKLENPPYVPAVHGDKLYYKTLCMTSQQYAGLHYNVHNLYGISEAVVTNFALSEIRGKRPFIISRSTFAGHGHFAGHWSGDVWSSWDDMRYSIPELLSYSIFGVPLMGADICGFNGNSTAALCQRWMELGAFYPFSRNHNTDNGVEQDPVAFGPEVVKASKKALLVRYALLPYLYTLFWRAHVEGETVARPLFFEFPNDVKTYNIDDQFLWGPAFMITPVLEEGVTEINPYFPSGVWYDYYTAQTINSNGQNMKISAPLDTIPLFIRGGSILCRQTPGANTELTKKSNLKIHAAADTKGDGFGYLYWDDGDSLNSVEEMKYSLLNFTMKSGELKSNVMWWSKDQPPSVDEITILGVTSPVTSVTINQAAQNFSYSTINKFLLIKNLNLSLKNPIIVQWK